MPDSHPEDHHRLVYAGAALAVAEHQITDPVLRDIVERKARLELTTGEAIAKARHHLQGWVEAAEGGADQAHRGG